MSISLWIGKSGVFWNVGNSWRQQLLVGNILGNILGHFDQNKSFQLQEKKSILICCILQLTQLLLTYKLRRPKSQKSVVFVSKKTQNNSVTWQILIQVDCTYCSSNHQSMWTPVIRNFELKLLIIQSSQTMTIIKIPEVRVSFGIFWSKQSPNSNVT